MTYLSAYLNELWELTVEISPYLLFGFLFAGILRVYFGSTEIAGGEKEIHLS